MTTSATPHTTPENLELTTTSTTTRTTTEMQAQILDNSRIILRDVYHTVSDKHQLSVNVVGNPDLQVGTVDDEDKYTATVILREHCDYTCRGYCYTKLIQGKPSKTTVAAVEVLLEATCEWMQDWCIHQKVRAEANNEENEMKELVGSGGMHWVGVGECKNEVEGSQVDDVVKELTEAGGLQEPRRKALKGTGGKRPFTVGEECDFGYGAVVVLFVLLVLSWPPALWRAWLR